HLISFCTLRPTSGTHPLSLHDALPIFEPPVMTSPEASRSSQPVFWISRRTKEKISSTRGSMISVSSCRERMRGLRSPTLGTSMRSEEHTSELQSLRHLVCRLLLEKKKQ